MFLASWFYNLYQMGIDTNNEMKIVHKLTFH